MTYSHVRYAETGLVKEMRKDVRVVYGPSVNPPESRALHTLAATFLVAFAMLFAAALPAQAQTTIWTATLTPRTTFSGTPVPLGCDNSSTGNRKCSNSNTLSDDFTDDGTTYAVTKFFTKNGVLTFRLNTGATAATQGLTLVIDSEEFVLKEADQINGAKTQWKWNSTTLGWTAGTDVAVSLVVTDAPATGQPTISGGGQVGKTLTAATDDIEDLDGLPTTPTFTYQWVRVDGSTDTDIPGAASETYTLTASDLGKQIKVKVSFTDLRSHAEGPLTSDAYPRNGTVTVVVLPGPCPAVNDWCATMTVADDGTGFGYEFDKSGSLDDNMIEYGGKEIEVFKLYVVIQSTRERFFFESFPRVPLGTVITVGDLTLTTDAESNDGSLANKWDYNPGELPPDLLWLEGQEVRVSLVLGSFPAEGAVTISGTAQVGQTLTADPSGITDTDGLTTATYTYQWLRVDADGVSNETNIGANAATYTPVAADVGKQIKVQVSFTDDRGHVETVTSDATVTVTGNGNGNDPALSITDASAAENEGHLLFEVTLSRSSRNVVKVDFETISGGTATEGVDYHARRIYTHVIPAGETTVQMGFALIEDTVNDPDETVMVRLSNARRVNAYGDKIKDLDITRAEATGTITAPPASTTNVPGLTIGIQDATGDEDDGWLLFKVKLSRKSDDLVCYDFEAISGGTATEGTDYLKIPKATYWMAIGKKVDKPFVLIIDDRVNDNGETVMVKISNARLCDDASQTLEITRAEATGIINNTDPLPQALMARFGRATAVEVVEQVEARLEARRERGFEARFAGRPLRSGMERDLGRDFLNRLGTATGASPQGAKGDPPGFADADPRTARGADPDWRGLLQTSFQRGDVLTGSAFELNQATRQGGAFSLWGRGAQSRFAGREGVLSLSGRVRTTMLGADYAKGSLVMGLPLFHSSSQGNYSGVDLGEVVSSVTGLYPWVGYKATERVTLWGVTGYGKGTLSLTPGKGAALKSGLSMAMAAAGLRGDLAALVKGGFGLAVKADALWVDTGIEGVVGVEGLSGQLAATQAAVTRFRTALEASRGYHFGSGLSLQPSLEVGLRRDGGDAETGAGVDLGGGLIVKDPLTGLSADVQIRMLLVHQAEGFGERGGSVRLSLDPTPRTPLGFKAQVTPSWGGRATSGAEALWSRETMAGLAAGRSAPGSRFDADFGYGLPVGSRLVGTPRLGIGTSGMARDYRLGYQLTLLHDDAVYFALGVDATRRESLRQGDEDQRVLGRITTRW